jgi:hypothetical protein
MLISEKKRENEIRKSDKKGGRERDRERGKSRRH